MKEKLKIGMMDLDQLDRGSRFPNLAQMKMSAWCKGQGHNVELIWGDKLDRLDDYDVLIASKVFEFTRIPEQLSSRMGFTLETYNVDIRELLQADEGGGRRSP